METTSERHSELRHRVHAESVPYIQDFYSGFGPREVGAFCSEIQPAVKKKEPL